MKNLFLIIVGLLALIGIKYFILCPIPQFSEQDNNFIMVQENI